MSTKFPQLETKNGPTVRVSFHALKQFRSRAFRYFPPEKLETDEVALQTLRAHTNSTEFRPDRPKWLSKPRAIAVPLTVGYVVVNNTFVFPLEEDPPTGEYIATTCMLNTKPVKIRR